MDDLQPTEQIYRLADTTYRNIEEVIPELKNLIAHGKSYQKALQNASMMAAQFYHLLGAIGVCISSLPGAVRTLGDGLAQVSTAKRECAVKENSWIDSIFSEFIDPLENHLNRQAKAYTAMRKSYQQKCSQQEQVVSKTESSIRAALKKEKKKSAPPGESRELVQVRSVAQQKLMRIRTDGLKRALLEERKLYCLMLDKLCIVSHNEISFYAKAHEAVSVKLPDWQAACSNPHSLPEESMVLLEAPMSPKVFRRTPTQNGEVNKQNKQPPVHTSSGSDQNMFVFSAAQPAPTKPPSGSSLPNQNSSEGFTFKPPSLSATDSGSADNILKLIPGADPTHQEVEPSATTRTRRPSCRVKGVYEYVPHAPEELEIHEGDCIDAVNEPQNGWQYGKNVDTGKDGWFPCQYVEQIWPATPEIKRQHSKKKPTPPIPPKDYTPLHVAGNSQKRQ